MTELSFEQFRAFLATNLSLAPEEITAETSFLFDLAIDSLKMVELIMRIESDLGVTIALEDAWDIETVGDAHRLCAQAGS